MKTKIKSILFIIIGIVLLDQVTKIEISTNITLNESVTIIKNFLNFSYTQNTGAAFNMFSNNTIFLIIISLLILVYLFFEIKKTSNNKIILSYSLIIGGLLGNLIDRVFLGYVRDFISFILFGKHMAIFNIADTCLVIGTILLIIFTLKEAIDENKNRKK